MVLIDCALGENIVTRSFLFVAFTLIPSVVFLPSVDPIFLEEIHVVVAASYSSLPNNIKQISFVLEALGAYRYVDKWLLLPLLL
jgi:hypothetical protein